MGLGGDKAPKSKVTKGRAGPGASDGLGRSRGALAPGARVLGGLGSGR